MKGLVFKRGEGAIRGCEKNEVIVKWRASADYVRSDQLASIWKATSNAAIMCA